MSFCSEFLGRDISSLRKKRPSCHFERSEESASQLHSSLEKQIPQADRRLWRRRPSECTLEKVLGILTGICGKVFHKRNVV